MALVLTEQEMLNRFSDSLRRASSIAHEIMKAEEKEKPRMFVDFIHEIKTAAGSAHQMAHTRPDQSPKWLTLRDLLEKIIEVGQVVPLMGQNQNGLWFSIKGSLDNLHTMGFQIATSMKAMSRDDVLADMDVRAANAPGLVIPK